MEHEIKISRMPAHSRVWVYQSSRKFSKSEIRQLKTCLETFKNDWTSHGKLMHACIEIFHNLFIVVCVDEKTASVSGCGIDKSVNFIQQLQNIFSVSLLNRMNVAYHNGTSFRLLEEQIQVCSVNDLPSLISQGKITENTFVFNNLVQTKEELEKNWEIPLKESWHKNFITSL